MLGLVVSLGRSLNFKSRIGLRLKNRLVQSLIEKTLFSRPSKIQNRQRPEKNFNRFSLKKMVFDKKFDFFRFLKKTFVFKLHLFLKVQRNFCSLMWVGVDSLKLYFLTSSKRKIHRGFLESSHALWCTVFFVTT